MRNLIVALAIVGIVACTANAGVVAFDNFDYADGALVPSSSWVNHSGTADDLLVSGGQVVVEHGAPSEDAHLMWTAVGGALYYGIDFSVDDLGAPYSGTDFEYFAHFMPDGSYDFRARLDVVAPSGAGDFSVGISTNGSTADATWAMDLTYGTTYRAIAMYDQDAGTSALWIDAVLESDTSILGADMGAPGDSMDSFALRQSDSSENETIRVDNLIVGTTFGNVVPEPATIALLGFGALALIRRR